MSKYQLPSNLALSSYMNGVVANLLTDSAARRTESDEHMYCSGHGITVRFPKGGMETLEREVRDALAFRDLVSKRTGDSISSPVPFLHGMIANPAALVLDGIVNFSSETLVPRAMIAPNVDPVAIAEKAGYTLAPMAKPQLRRGYNDCAYLTGFEGFTVPAAIKEEAATIVSCGSARPKRYLGSTVIHLVPSTLDAQRTILQLAG